MAEVAAACLVPAAPVMVLCKCHTILSEQLLCHRRARCRPERTDVAIRVCERVAQDVAAERSHATDCSIITTPLTYKSSLQTQKEAWMA
jgi:hypothetical protein